MEGLGVSEDAQTAAANRSPANGGSVTVTLLNFPLQVYAQARQHQDELLREFALMAIRPPQSRSGHEVPAGLLALIERLGRRYGGTADRTDELRDAAVARGETSIDLAYTVPRSVGPAMQELHDLLEQADAFCQQEQLLTLAATPVERRFREWFLAEFASQAAGAEPSAWAGPLNPDT
jgi:hypothetical protein